MYFINKLTGYTANAMMYDQFKKKFVIYNTNDPNNNLGEYDTLSLLLKEWKEVAKRTYKPETIEKLKSFSRLLDHNFKFIRYDAFKEHGYAHLIIEAVVEPSVNPEDLNKVFTTAGKKIKVE